MKLSKSRRLERKLKLDIRNERKRKLWAAWSELYPHLSRQNKNHVEAMHEVLNGIRYTGPRDCKNATQLLNLTIQALEARQ